MTGHRHLCDETWEHVDERTQLDLLTEQYSLSDWTTAKSAAVQLKMIEVIPSWKLAYNWRESHSEEVQLKLIDVFGVTLRYTWHESLSAAVQIKLIDVFRLYVKVTDLTDSTVEEALTAMFMEYNNDLSWRHCNSEKIQHMKALRGDKINFKYAINKKDILTNFLTDDVIKQSLTYKTDDEELLMMLLDIHKEKYDLSGVRSDKVIHKALCMGLWESVCASEGVGATQRNATPLYAIAGPLSSTWLLDNGKIGWEDMKYKSYYVDVTDTYKEFMLPSYNIDTELKILSKYNLNSVDVWNKCSEEGRDYLIRRYGNSVVVGVDAVRDDNGDACGTHTDFISPSTQKKLLVLRNDPKLFTLSW